MRTQRLRGVLNRLLPDGLTDGQLLARFIDGREEAAFAALVRRHGPMVLGVCRRVLGHAQDAEDAFQATFLVLARKAASVARREAVGAFLHGVAYRTALAARRRAARRRAVETEVDEMPHPEVPANEPQDWRPILDREVNRLPEKFRSVLLLCDLEGKTRREAARQLGVPEGTIASRLTTARRTLARRLARCGVVLSGGALAVALAGQAAAAVPAPLAVATVRAAALVAAGQVGGAGAPAVALMNEVLRSMLMSRLKVYLGAALAVVLLGVGGVAYRAAGQTAAPQPPGQDGRDPLLQNARQALNQAPREANSRPLTELELLRREVDILKARVELLEERQRAREGERRAPKGRGGMMMPGGPGPQPGMQPGVMGPGGGLGGQPPPQGQLGPQPRGPAPRQQASDPFAPGQAAPRQGQEAAPAPPPGQGGSGQPERGSDPTTAPRGTSAGAIPPAGPPGGYGGGQQATPPAETRAEDPSAARGKPGEAAANGANADDEIDAAVKALREARDEDARRRAVDALEKALQKLRQEKRPPANSLPINRAKP